MHTSIIGRAVLGATLVVAACGGDGNGEPGGDQSTALRRRDDSQMCGGFAGISCPSGYSCQLDGVYPDAAGHCVADAPVHTAKDAGRVESGPSVDSGPSDEGGIDAESAPRCGGFAGFVCPSGFDCEDNPSDSCDPAAGDRDCMGICVPR